MALPNKKTSIETFTLPNKETFFEKLAVGLKNNKVLTHLEIDTSAECYDILAEALAENDTLTSLIMTGNEPMPDQLVKFREAIADNRSLKSLEAHGINKWTDALKSLRTNNTLQTIIRY